MRKVFAFIAVMLFIFSSSAYAAGGKVRQDNGQGTTGTTGGGATTEYFEIFGAGN